MKKLKIKYRVQIIPFFFLSVSRQFPEKYDELTEEQFRAYEEFYFNYLTGDEFIAKIFGIKILIVKRFSDFDKYCLLDGLSFFKYPESYLQFVSCRGYSARIRPDELREPLNIFIDQIKNKQKND